MMTKVLVLILLSVMVAETADNYATADKKNQVVWKNITSRRDDSLTLDKVGSEDKVLCEVGERFNKSNRDVYTTNDDSWIFGSNVLDGSRFENHTYIICVIAGKTLMLRSWSLNDTTLSLSIKEGDIVRLNLSFNGTTYKFYEDNRKRSLLKINFTERELSLILDKVGKEDEGQYEMEESINKGVGDASKREDCAWRFHVNVLESHEILQGSIGERIIILQINKSTTSFPRLYHNDQLVTVLLHDDCDIKSKSHFYGRLKCEDDKVMKRYRIEIQNVAQKDAGLYRVNINGHDTYRCFLNITANGNTVTSRMVTVTIHASSERNYDKPSTESSSSENTNIPLSVLIYIIDIIAGSVGVIILMICLIWIRRKNIHRLEAVAERCHAIEECATDLYLTPTLGDRHLPIPLSEVIDTENMQPDSCMGLLQATQSISMNVYDIIAISGNDDPENLSHDLKLMFESTEATNPLPHHTSGYLTVLV